MLAYGKILVAYRYKMWHGDAIGRAGQMTIRSSRVQPPVTVAISYYALAVVEVNADKIDVLDAILRTMDVGSRWLRWCWWRWWQWQWCCCAWWQCTSPSTCAVSRHNVLVAWPFYLLMANSHRPIRLDKTVASHRVGRCELSRATVCRSLA